MISAYHVRSFLIHVDGRQGKKLNTWLPPSIAQSLTEYKMHVHIASQLANKRRQNLDKQKELWYGNLIIVSSASICGAP